jgi:hypothetical protein
MDTNSGSNVRRSETVREHQKGLGASGDTLFGGTCSQSLLTRLPILTTQLHRNPRTAPSAFTQASRAAPTQASPKNSAISRLALSGESEPCTRFWVISVA